MILNTNLIRYMFDFVENEQKILLGFMNQRYRKMFNLRREFLKLFLFAFRIDYKRDLFIKNIVIGINCLRKKFPHLDQEMIYEFVALYVIFTNSNEKSIVFTFPPNYKYHSNTISTFDKLNCKLYSDDWYDKKKIFLGCKSIATHLERLGYKSIATHLERLAFNNFNNFPLQYSQENIYPKLAKANLFNNNLLNEFVNFSKINFNYFTEIKWRYDESNQNILDELFHYNPSAIKTLILDKTNFYFNMHSLETFDKLRVEPDIYYQKDFEKWKDWLIQIKNFSGQIYLKYYAFSESIFQKISELFSENLTNLVEIKINVGVNFNFNFGLFTKNNFNLRKVYLCSHKDYDVAKMDSNFIQIGPDLIFNVICDEALLIGAKTVIERNLVSNENYFQNAWLKGNAKFIIEFFNFMVEQMSPNNFRKFFSKISKLSIINNKKIPEFTIQSSAKENIRKCFLNMTNLKTLKIEFRTEMTKYLNLFQFDLLKSLKALKMNSSDDDTGHLEVLKQIKDIKISYLSHILFNLAELDNLAKYQKHLVCVEINIYFGIANFSTFKKSMNKFIEESKNLNQITFYYIDHSHCYKFIQALNDLNEKYKHITIKMHKST